MYDIKNAPCLLYNVKSNNAKEPSLLKEYYEYVLFPQEVLNKPPARSVSPVHSTAELIGNRLAVGSDYLLEDSPLMFFLSVFAVRDI